MLSKDRNIEMNSADGLDIPMEEENSNDVKVDELIKDTTHPDSFNQSKEEVQTHQQSDLDDHDNILIQSDIVIVDEDSSNVAPERQNETEDGDKETLVEEEENDAKSADTLSNGSKKSQQMEPVDDIEASGQVSIAEMQSEEEETISNDVSVIDEQSQHSSQRTETVTLLSFAPSQESSASVEEDVQEDIKEDMQEDVEEAFDRDEYYALYDQAVRKYQEETNKNNHLHRRVSEYYRKRKMLHVFVEGKIAPDRRRYSKCLDDVIDLSERSEKEQTRIRLDLIRLKVKYIAKEFEVNELFKKLQHAELEMGKELESTATDTAGASNAVITERYLKRQKIHLNNIIDMRLNYIKLKNRYNEKKVALDALDNLGSNLHLIDYEQLKIDNRNLFEKFEEKETELLKVRRRCQNTMQVLAHIREKTEAVGCDMKYLIEKLEDVENEYADVREELNDLKQRRDYFRKLFDELKSEACLLARPKLLRDMANAEAEIKSLSVMVEQYREECESTASIVDRMRQVMTSTKRMSKLRAKLAGEKVASVIHSESTESSDFHFDFEDSSL